MRGVKHVFGVGGSSWVRFQHLQHNKQEMRKIKPVSACF